MAKARKRIYAEGRDYLRDTGLLPHTLSMSGEEFKRIQALLREWRGGLGPADYARKLHAERGEPSPEVQDVRLQGFVLIERHLPAEQRKALNAGARLGFLVRLKKDGHLCEIFARPDSVEQAKEARRARAIEILKGESNVRGKRN